MDFSFIDLKNDFVYLDPPYHQSGERFYTRVPFDEKEQIRLRDFVYELTIKVLKLCFQIITLPLLETYTKTSSLLILELHTQSMNNAISLMS
ncbi:D12 class N6 adenine-specific DNA methyltransferase family protein [Orientia tsutsugamushi str. Sido]|nr:D12 class N6 adenine-specific DNA methyltransferase family protein [Orientia tsutsugamushi str. Sido]